jgi:large subunit ribosomal protein L28
MPFKCTVCGKGTTVGNQIDRRGMPKYKGGVGLKITGKTKRKFRPNLQRVRARVDGSVKRVYVCAKCLRSGHIVKA